MDNMTIEEEWLSQILGQETRKTYSRTLTNFKEFMQIESTDDLIKLRQSERNFETRIIQYYQWLQKKKEVSANTARNYVIGLQSLFSYIGAGLKLKNKLPRMHMKIENWKPSIEDLQKIFKLNDISVKGWMSLSRDVPARMSDLLRITNEQIASGEFLLLSKKESVVGKCYISEETKVLFEQLKSAKITLPRTQRGVDKMMENACSIAGLERRINQHLFRKIWISNAINIGIPEMIYKILSFKSVPQEILTYYLDREELKESWKRVIEAMPLESKSNGKVNNLQTAIDLVMKALRKMIEKETGILGGEEGTPSDKEVIEMYLEERE
jgi:site-specific recombinase XerD